MKNDNTKPKTENEKLAEELNAEAARAATRFYSESYTAAPEGAPGLIDSLRKVGAATARALAASLEEGVACERDYGNGGSGTRWSGTRFHLYSSGVSTEATVLTPDHAVGMTCGGHSWAATPWGVFWAPCHAYPSYQCGDTPSVGELNISLPYGMPLPTTAAEAAEAIEATRAAEVAARAAEIAARRAAAEAEVDRLRREIAARRAFGVRPSRLSPLLGQLAAARRSAENL